MLTSVNTVTCQHTFDRSFFPIARMLLTLSAYVCACVRASLTQDATSPSHLHGDVRDGRKLKAAGPFCQESMMSAGRRQQERLENFIDGRVGHSCNVQWLVEKSNEFSWSFIKQTFCYPVFGLVGEWPWVSQSSVVSFPCYNEDQQGHSTCVVSHSSCFAIVGWKWLTG